MFSDKKWASHTESFFYVKRHSHAAFMLFYLSLNFVNLTMIKLDLWVWISEFILLGVHVASSICRCTYFIKFQKFGPLFVQILFLLLFSLSFLGLLCVLVCLMVSHRSLRLCSGSSLLPPLFLRLDTLYWHILKFTDSLFQQFRYIIQHLSHFNYCIFNNISFWFLL